MASTSLEIVISAKDNFSGTANSVIGSLNRINSAAGRVGKGVGQVGMGLARVGIIAGTALAGGLVFAAKQAINFEDAFAGVRKTADLTETEFTALATSFRKMATEIPIGADQLARLGEIAGALGIAGVDNIREFSRVTALLGVTTNLSAEMAAESLGKISNAYSFTAKEYEQFASALVDLGNKGASTEDAIIAIAERSAGAAKTIGIAKDEFLGWSAAVANLPGVEVEAGGTSLQRFFIRTAQYVSEGKDELKVLSETAGQTAATFKKDFNDKPSSALGAFIVGLGKLDKNARIAVLSALGFDDARLFAVINGLATNTDNLTNSVKTNGTAWQANTALGVEAGKRFDTLKSKLTVLKNNFIEMAMVVGEGFTPAIGRAAEKLTAFLGDEGNRANLRRFGEDIGRAIDSINWGEVIAGAQTFWGILKSILDVILALPTEIKAAGAAFIGLNKLSGGLIGQGVGNIVGGLAAAGSRGVASRIPGVGAIFAQPVYVTNWPMGGLGGPGGGPSAKDAGSWFKLLVPLAVAAAVVELGVFTSGVNDPRHQQFDPATGRTRTFRGTNVAEEQIANLERSRGPLAERAAGGDQDAIRKLAAIEAEIARLRGDVQTQTTEIKSAGDRRVVPDLAFQSLAEALAQTFGTHEAATGAFGGAELKAFRGGDMSLLDERIRYLSGAQGSGAGTEGFQALVGRDIAALETALTTASGTEADRIREGIDILSGILAAKKFEPSPALIDAVTAKPAEDTEAGRALNAMVTLLQADKSTEAERARNAMATLPEVKNDIRLNPITNVTVNLSWRDVQTKVTTQSRIGPASGSAGGGRALSPYAI